MEAMSITNQERADVADSNNDTDSVRDADSVRSADNVRPVQMRLRLETIAKIDELKRFFETSNRTDAVVRAIRLAHSIASEMAQGSRIELHRRSGEVRELLIR